MANRRPLTNNEEKFVKHVFRKAIPLRNVEVVSRGGRFGGFTPLGSVNMDPLHYRMDYIGPDMYHPVPTRERTDQFYHAHHFLHEVGHVWQYFTGMPMLLAKAQDAAAVRQRLKTGAHTSKFYATYDYDPTAYADLMDYTMEQQCDIIADYFALVMWGRTPNNNEGTPSYGVATQPELEGILDNFLADREYVKKERRFWRGRARVRGLER